MKTTNPILAAVDFSSSSGQVLTHGAKLAQALRQPLIAVHIVPENRLRDWSETMGREASALARVEQLAGQLEELIKDHCGDLAVVVEVRVGNPQRMLDQLVREFRADLLVIGAHDVSKRRLGSVASRCARVVPADILILRDWQTRLFRKIVVGVDFSRSSGIAVERAISFAEAHHASLEIIHVLFPPTRDPWGRVLEQPLDSPVSYETRVRERAQIRFEGFLKPWEERLAAMCATRLLLEGESPAAAIIAHVEASETDLTVMGSHEGSWIEDFVLGSNAERLLHDSCCSVLITRG